MIFQIVLLIIVTILTVIILIALTKSGKYIPYVENLDGSEYFLKDFYVVGFYLNDTKLFKMRGKLEKDLKKQSKLVWDNIYSEYYANLAWVQFLTLTLLVVAFGIPLCVLFQDSWWMAGGIVLLGIIVIWNISLSKMKEVLDKRREECNLEFPNMISKLSLLIHSGMVLRDAWELVAYSKEGEIYNLMKKACDCMVNGESDSSAIYKFGVLSDSSEIKKFTSAMVQGIEKGNSELADFLTAQASELWAHKRQLALQKGEIAAGKLIIPLGLTFGGIILIILSAAMQSMAF